MRESVLSYMVSTGFHVSVTRFTFRFGCITYFSIRFIVFFLHQIETNKTAVKLKCQLKKRNEPTSGSFFHRFPALIEGGISKTLSLGEKSLSLAKKSFHFDGGNLKFPLSLEEKSYFWAKKP